MSFATPGAVGSEIQNQKKKQKNEKETFPPSIIIEVHGLNDQFSTWAEMNGDLQRRNARIKIGGFFIFNEADFQKQLTKVNEAPFSNFFNQGLLEPKEKDALRSNLKEESHKEYWISKDSFSVSEKILQTALQTKVESLLKQNQSVIFSFTFLNNQDNFIHQGKEVKYIIDMVRPSGRKVDIIAHSMGSLATASYISGISGVHYGRDIDQFVTLGPPFNGSDLGIVGVGVGGALKVNHEVPNPPIPAINPAYAGRAVTDKGLEGFRTHGEAYRCLEPGSPAIKQMKAAWAKTGSQSGVRGYVLQGWGGDWVVSEKSAFALKGMSYHRMDQIFHTSEPKNKKWQKLVYDVLAEKTKWRPNEIQDHTTPDPIRRGAKDYENIHIPSCGL